MNYKPLTSQEAIEMMRPPLIEEGRYQFEVVEAHNTDKFNNALKDKNGSPMTKIRLRIWDEEGKERSLYTHLFWDSANKMAYRTRHFAESVGVLEMYENGSLLDNIGTTLSCTGWCDIYIQKGRDKNDGSNEKWPDKNEIRDFILINNSEKIDPMPKSAVSNKENFIDNHLPF